MAKRVKFAGSARPAMTTRKGVRPSRPGNRTLSLGLSSRVAQGSLHMRPAPRILAGDRDIASVAPPDHAVPRDGQFGGDKRPPAPYARKEPLMQPFDSGEPAPHLDRDPRHPHLLDTLPGRARIGIGRTAYDPRHSRRNDGIHAGRRLSPMIAGL
jgi:hypothetical protein